MTTFGNSPATNPEATAPDAHASPAGDQPVKTRVVPTRRILWLVGALLAAIAGVFGYRWIFGAAKVHYTTVVVTRGDIESTVVAAGIVQPVAYVDVGAQTSGKLKSLKVKRGDHVEKNQVLAEIDPVQGDTALTSANAALDNITSQRAAKQAQLVLARAQRSRNDQLFAKGMISAGARDITRANYDVAVADVRSVTAQMQQATAAVNTAKANLGYTTITAPMAGDVVSISILEGQTLNANQQAPTIMRIADMSTVTVWAQVSEADIIRVKIGQDVYFTVLGSTQRWNGKVRQILPTPELINNVVFYDVLFDIPNPEHELSIQMTAQVFIVLAQAKDALLLPTIAIGTTGEGEKMKVQVLNAAGRLETRAIKIGMKSEISAEIKSGLKENDKVVLRGVAARKGNAGSALSGRRGP